MGGTQTNRHQQIPTLLPLRRDRPIGHLMREDSPGLIIEVPFVGYLALVYDSLDMMTVDFLAGHANRVFLLRVILAVLLTDYILTDHASPLADVQLWRKVLCGPKFSCIVSIACGFFS